jgi:Type II secretion system (T2SS), protein E, N-terminal domain
VTLDPIPDHTSSTGTVPLVDPVRELRGFPLGTILLRLGFVAEGPINEALAECERAHKPLGRYLVERGALAEADLQRALSSQKGLPFVELEHVAVDRQALGLLSAHAANTLGALPLGYTGEVPIVAVGDATNTDKIDDVRSTIGGDVVIAVASPARLREAVRDAYRPVEAPAPAPPQAQVVPIAPAAAPAVAPAPPPEPAPPPPPPDPQPAVRPVRVVATTVAGPIELARCATHAEAQARAQELARQLAAGGWISSGDRLVRAEAVIAIELSA